VNDLNLSKEENIMVILGSEGEGVSRTISRIANDRVYIPPKLDQSMTGKYPFNMIDSLNVGVSAALMLYHIKQKRL
jgi:tRNA G18 (ribose-2'-O)-methylase SpoU